jgi:hypothetical protein
MEKVVYILGAGFSRPLGLPLMSDFLIKSKDMFFVEPEKYKYFQDVLSTIQSISNIKNYYNCNLFNIEEILSILEMNYNLKQDNQLNKFQDYIADVIKYYTPPFKPKKYKANWLVNIFKSSNKIWELYCHFVLSILNIKFEKKEEVGLICSKYLL